jgi:hypothetical protein
LSSSRAERFADAVRSSTALFNAGDFEGAFAGLAPDVEWHFGAWLPDGGVLFGREALVSFYRRLEDAGDWTVEVLDVEELARDRFVVHTRGRSVGRVSGISDEREAFQLYELGPGGAAARVREFATRDEAHAVE